MEQGKGAGEVRGGGEIELESWELEIPLFLG